MGAGRRYGHGRGWGGQLWLWVPFFPPQKKGGAAEKQVGGTGQGQVGSCCKERGSSHGLSRDLGGDSGESGSRGNRSVPSGGLQAELGENFMINNNTNNKHYDETHRSVPAVAVSEGPPK